MTVKTYILWREKRARTYKMIGAATADGSVNTIHDMARAARDGGGSLALVTVTHSQPVVRIARAMLDVVLREIQSGRAYDDPAWKVLLRVIPGPGRHPAVIMIGQPAIAAYETAQARADNWNLALYKHGTVPVAHTRALGGRDAS